MGDCVLVGLPFELPVETGRRIEKRGAGAVASSGVRRVVVSSVGNEYAGYATTPEEYGLQYYEGGHTLYGPSTQPFIAAQAARLAADVMRDGTVEHVADQRTFDLRVHRYLPESRTADELRPLGPPPALTDLPPPAECFFGLTLLYAPPPSVP